MSTQAAAIDFGAGDVKAVVPDAGSMQIHILSTVPGTPTVGNSTAYMQDPSGAVAPLVSGVSNLTSPNGSIVLSGSTGAITEDIAFPVQAQVSATSKVFLTSDMDKFWSRVNGGVAMTDTMPTGSALVNGLHLIVANDDTTASNTLTAAAGQFFVSAAGVAGASTFVLNPSRRSQFVWYQTGGFWRILTNNNNLTKGKTGTTFTLGNVPKISTYTNGSEIDDSGFPAALATGAASGFMSAAQFTNLGNQSGTNTGNVTLTTVGAVPNANGASLAGQVLNLQPSDSTFAGTMSAANFNVIANYKKGWVNLNDFGVTAASSTAAVAAAVTSALAALPNGGTILLTELFPIAGTITVATAGITFLGSDRNNCGFTTNSTTLTMFVVNQWFVTFQNMQFATSVNRSAGYCIDSPESGGYSYTKVINCAFYGTSSLKHWNVINMGATLMDIDDIECRFFANNMIEVNGQSDHRITRAVCDNAVQAAGGIVVIKTASLLLANCNIIHAGQGLDITPANGGTIPSIKGVNCFFDNCTNGLRFNPVGTGVWYRSEFSNCWFSSATGAGVLFNSPQFDGIKFSSCDFYGNAVGIDANAGGGGWEIIGSDIAGNTTAGIRVAASASHFPLISANQIGPSSAFGANAVGIIVGAGTYTGLKIQANDVSANTSALTLGAVTVTNWNNYSINDNAGINPRGAVTTPAVGASTVAVTNTTGFRVTIYEANAGTGPTACSVNGVVVTTFVSLVATTGRNTFQLDPGGTIAFTYTVVPTWVWVAN